MWALFKPKSKTPPPHPSSSSGLMAGSRQPPSRSPSPPAEESTVDWHTPARKTVNRPVLADPASPDARFKSLDVAVSQNGVTSTPPDLEPMVEDCDPPLAHTEHAGVSTTDAAPRINPVQPLIVPTAAVGTRPPARQDPASSLLPSRTTRSGHKPPIATRKPKAPRAGQRTRDTPNASAKTVPKRKQPTGQTTGSVLTSVSAFPDLTPALHIPRRGQRFPKSYVALHHPRTPAARKNEGRNYVMVVDFDSVDAMKDLLLHGFRSSISRRGNIETSTDVATGLEIHHDNGLLILDTKDVLWLRNQSGSGNPDEDVCVSFACEIAELGVHPSGKPMLEYGIELRDRLIGEAHKNNGHAPSTVTTDGVTVRTGGTEFERNPRSIPLEGCPRAIPVSVSVEIPKNMMHAPSVGNKFHGEADRKDTGWKTRREWMEFCALVASRGLQFGPADIADLFSNWADLVNAPRTGHDSNPGFSNQQTNFAGGLNRADIIENIVTSIEDLGGFGDIHGDTNDFPPGLSSLVSMSQLPPDLENVHPGMIVMVCLGVARLLNTNTNMYMCGVRGHAGTQPTYDGAVGELRHDIIRILDIMYMSDGAMGAQGTTALAALAPNKILEISSEYRDPRIGDRSQAVQVTHATYARDGISIMPAEALMKLVSRDLLTVNVNVSLQMPEFMDVRVDRDAMLRAWSYTDEAGVRRTLDGWPLGPGHGPGGKTHVEGSTAPFGNDARARVIEQMESHRALTEHSIPLTRLAALATSKEGSRAALLGTYADRAKDGKDPLTGELYYAPGEAPPASPTAGTKRKASEAQPHDVRPATKKMKAAATVLGAHLSSAHLDALAAPFVPPEAPEAPVDGLRRSSRQIPSRTTGVVITPSSSATTTLRPPAPIPGAKQGVRSAVRLRAARLVPAAPPQPDNHSSSSSHSSDNSDAASAALVPGPRGGPVGPPSLPQPDSSSDHSDKPDAASALSAAAALPGGRVPAATPQPDSESSSSHDSDFSPEDQDVVMPGPGHDSPMSDASDGEPELDPRETTKFQNAKLRARDILKEFSARKLTQLLADVTAQLDAAEKASSLKVDPVRTVTVLETAMTELRCDPLGEGAAAAVHGLNTQLNVLVLNANLQGIFLTLQRQRILIAASLGYRWMAEQAEPYLDHKLEELLGLDHTYPVPKADEWMYRLLVDVNNARQTGSRTIQASDYLTCITGSAKLAQFHVDDSTDLAEELKTRTLRIVHQWLKFPDDSKTDSALAARFAAHLHNFAGPSAMLVPRIWSAFYNVSRTLLNSGFSKKSVPMEDIVPWAEALEDHPISDENSHERQLLDALGAQYRRLDSKAPAIPGSRSKPNPQPDNMLQFLRLALRNQSSSNDQPTRVPPVSELPEGPARQALLWMNENSDHRYPFRLEATSYLGMRFPREKGSPLDMNILRDDPQVALFSLAQWRSITYHSDFSSTRAMFDNADDFLNAVRGKPSSHYAIDRAYGGQPQPRAAKYEWATRLNWETANKTSANSWLSDLEWPELAADGSQPPPAAVQSYSSVLDVVCPKVKNKPVFAFCGPLTAHLLVSDFVDAGVVKPPTALELGRVIARIRAGAIAGLQALDYFHEARPMPHHISRSFVALYDHLDTELTQDEKRRMRFGPLMLEHSLLGITRCARLARAPRGPASWTAHQTFYLTTTTILTLTQSDNGTPSAPQASSSTEHTRTLRRRPENRMVRLQTLADTIQPESLASPYEPWLHELQRLLDIEHPGEFQVYDRVVCWTGKKQATTLGGRFDPDELSTESSAACWIRQSMHGCAYSIAVMYTSTTSPVGKTQQDFLSDGPWHVWAMIRCAAGGKHGRRILIWDPNFGIPGLSQQRQRDVLGWRLQFVTAARKNGNADVWINRRVQERNEDGRCVPLTLAFLQTLVKDGLDWDDFVKVAKR
ncbi:hypothetical protein C8F04DRAFT_1190497 [Mycena alexandri]|uniref:Uncharacterized protein n=1 Tax=Mycena alexandri TaxID=1745969 RepID=A0AAD6SGC5_9AGAR|nr:hypothetical protein C8F04DRAFT_1190497 [Mycena alexandri]